MLSQTLNITIKEIPTIATLSVAPGVGYGVCDNSLISSSRGTKSGGAFFYGKKGGGDIAVSCSRAARPETGTPLTLLLNGFYVTFSIPKSSKEQGNNKMFINQPQIRLSWSSAQLLIATPLSFLLINSINGHRNTLDLVKIDRTIVLCISGSTTRLRQLKINFLWLAQFLIWLRQVGLIAWLWHFFSVRLMTLRGLRVCL